MALRAYQGRVVGVADLALRTECLVLPVRAAMTRPRGCGVTPRIPRRKADGAGTSGVGLSSRLALAAFHSMRSRAGSSGRGTTRTARMWCGRSPMPVGLMREVWEVNRESLPPDNRGDQGAQPLVREILPACRRPSPPLK